MRWTINTFNRLKSDKDRVGYSRTWEKFDNLNGSKRFSSRVRVWPFISLVIVIMVMLSGRLFQLTVVEGSYHRQRSDGNRLLSVRLGAERGIIFDRHNKPLVRNIPTYKRQQKGTTLKQGMFETIAREEALSYSHDPSQRVYFDIAREYLCGRACASLLGYVNEIDAAELEKQTGAYIMGDLIGKMGLEKTLERELRGQVGQELVEVDAMGEVVRRVGEQLPQPGIDYTLTLDSDLQQYAYELLEDMVGSVIVMKPETGEILALVTNPSFDPDNIVMSLSEPGKPFFNRALAAAYPPGSVFKIVTSVAGLEEKKVVGSTAFEDTGVIMIDDYRFGNWFWLEYGRTDGMVDIVKALQRSNDIYYYRLGGLLGANLIADWARLFGFGEAWMVGGIKSVTGLVPDIRWKERTKGEKWFLGNTYHYAIGQGDLTVTPLQVTLMTGAIANKGSLCAPKILMSELGVTSCRQLNLETETLRLVTEGLKRACEPGGTAGPFFDIGGEVACKTGTAQHEARTLPHAWFTMYAPIDKPEIVVTVMLERAGQGSEIAAPIAREVWEWWKERE